MGPGILVVVSMLTARSCLGASFYLHALQHPSGRTPETVACEYIGAPQIGRLQNTGAVCHGELGDDLHVSFIVCDICTKGGTSSRVCCTFFASSPVPAHTHIHTRARATPPKQTQLPRESNVLPDKRSVACTKPAGCHCGWVDDWGFHGGSDGCLSATGLALSGVGHGPFQRPTDRFNTSPSITA